MGCFLNAVHSRADKNGMTWEESISSQSAEIMQDWTVQERKGQGNLDSAGLGSEGSLNSAGSGNCGPNSRELELWLGARQHR